MSVIPENEAERLNALRRYDILDTPPDGSFDRLTALAARLFKVPIALVTLVDYDRIWFKSTLGLEAKQINRDPGLCASVILQDEVYVVVNAQIDPRTLANPLVTGEMGLRFYAAAPLRTHDSYNLGTICIIDFYPRDINFEEKVTLKDLAAIVMDEIELRLASIRSIKHERQLRNKALQKANLLENLAYVDSLTGLGNRRAFDSDLEKYIFMLDHQEICELSLAMIDLDGLKQVNNFKGHSAGDFLLKSFADNLRSGLPENDQVYRFGGDEFALILPETNTKDFGLLNYMFEQIIEQTRQITGFYEIGASLGIAAFSEIQRIESYQKIPKISLVSISDQTISLADKRMYAQKKQHYQQRQRKA